jgi:hypothetical protein
VKFNHRILIVLVMIVALLAGVALAEQSAKPTAAATNVAPKASGAPPATPTAAPVRPGRRPPPIMLTPEQQKKVQDMMAKYNPELKKIAEDKTLSPDQRNQKMAEIRQNMQKEFESILTPDQLKAMKAARKKMEAQRESMKKNWRGIVLTDDQKAKMKFIGKKFSDLRTAVNADAKLTPEQKREKVLDINKKMMKEQEKILTPDQLKKLKESRGKRMQMKPPGAPPKGAPTAAPSASPTASAKPAPSPTVKK